MKRVLLQQDGIFSFHGKYNFANTNCQEFGNKNTSTRKGLFTFLLHKKDQENMAFGKNKLYSNIQYTKVCQK